MKRASMITLGVLAALGLTISACATPTAERVVETVVVEHTVEVVKTVEVTEESTPGPTPMEPETVETETMVVCIGEEPETLYWFGGSIQSSAAHVYEAIYDGPIDNRTYAHQPVILRKLPSLEDGDAVINTVTVQEGDIVINDQDAFVELVPGEVVRPAGCRSTECAVEFDGTPIEMDQMAVTFELLDGITWSDGHPLTADDSVYGFELQADPDTLASRYLIGRTASYEAIDETTTVWTGLPGFIDELYAINFWQPFPRHLWQEELGYAAAELVEAEESARKPMGWGPYMITEWAEGDHITVEKNPNYFRADEGLPNLDTIIYRFVPDTNAAVAQLVSGECDVATPDTAVNEQADLLIKLEQEGLIALAFENNRVWEHIDFGINPADDYDRPDFFEDVRTRSAIAYCLDRQRAIDTILYGQSPLLNAYIPPSHPLYAGDILSTYPYDPEQGMALLEEVGWVDENEDGVREAAGVEGIVNGTAFEITLTSNTDPVREAYMTLFQQDLAECGIDVTLENLPTPEFYAEGPDGTLFGRRFDLAALALIAYTIPTCENYLGTEAHIPSEANQWNGYNTPGFQNEAYDAACLQALGAEPGSEAWREGHREAQRIFSEQLPVLPLFLRVKLAAARPSVRNFTMNPTEDSAMWNIETLDLEP
jgi:peptide/nickel transport system substrate-binding protein